MQQSYMFIMLFQKVTAILRWIFTTSTTMLFCIQIKVQWPMWPPWAARSASTRRDIPSVRLRVVFGGIVAHVFLVAWPSSRRLVGWWYRISIQCVFFDLQLLNWVHIQWTIRPPYLPGVLIFWGNSPLCMPCVLEHYHIGIQSCSTRPSLDGSIV